MSSFIDQRVAAYLDLASIPVTKLSAKAAAPLVAETNAFTKDELEGELANSAPGSQEDPLCRAILPTRSAACHVRAGQTGHQVDDRMREKTP